MAREFWFDGKRMRKLKPRRWFSPAERALRRGNARRIREAMDAVWAECALPPPPDHMIVDVDCYNRERAAHPEMFGPGKPFGDLEHRVVGVTFHDGIKIDPPQFGSVEIIE